MFIDIIGYAAGLLTIAVMIPQLVKTFKLKSAKDISLTMVSSYALAVLLWAIYGIFIGSLPLIITDFIGFAIAIAEIILILIYRKNNRSNLRI